MKKLLLLSMLAGGVFVGTDLYSSEKAKNLAAKKSHKAKHKSAKKHEFETKKVATCTIADAPTGKPHSRCTVTHKDGSTRTGKCMIRKTDYTSKKTGKVFKAGTAYCKTRKKHHKKKKAGHKKATAAKK